MSGLWPSNYKTKIKTRPKIRLTQRIRALIQNRTTALSNNTPHSVSIAVHIIAGPTASGKSARAMEWAARHNGVIINADSMQIYDGLPILTAQPTAGERASLPHEMYGILTPDETCSAARWREQVIQTVKACWAQSLNPVIVGGTGFYIKALLEGLSPIPAVPDTIRHNATALQAELGNPAFHAALEKIDPVMAMRLHPNDTARLIRAYEVKIATGKSLAEWQSLPLSGPPEGWQFSIELIMPERTELYARCDARLKNMIAQGVLEEIAAFSDAMDNGTIPGNSPLVQALGYQPLRDYIRGIHSKEAAVAAAQAETRQYAKRQVTWFRHQLKA